MCFAWGRSHRGLLCKLSTLYIHRYEDRWLCIHAHAYQCEVNQEYISISETDAQITGARVVCLVRWHTNRNHDQLERCRALRVPVVAQRGWSHNKTVDVSSGQRNIRVSVEELSLLW